MLQFLFDVRLTVASLAISARLLLVPISRLLPEYLQIILCVFASVSASVLPLSISHNCDPVTGYVFSSATWEMTQEDSLPSIPTAAKVLPDFGFSLSSTLPEVNTSSPASDAVLISSSSDGVSLQFSGLASLHFSNVSVIVDLPTVPAAPPSIVPLDLPFSHLTSASTDAIVVLSMDVPLFVPSIFSVALSSGRRFDTVARHRFHFQTATRRRRRRRGRRRRDHAHGDHDDQAQQDQLSSGHQQAASIRSEPRRSARRCWASNPVARARSAGEFNRFHGLISGTIHYSRTSCYE